MAAKRHHQNVLLSRALLGISCTAIIVAVGVLIGIIWLHAYYEAQGAFSFDTSLFWAVGRGILNGLVPYKDLYENKGMGIFLLNAFSFALTGTPRLAHYTLAALIVIMPLMTTGAVYICLNRDITCHTRGDRIEKWLLIGMTFAWASLCTVYTDVLGGELLAEFFGAFAVTAYLCTLLVANRSKHIWLWVSACSVSIWLAILFKEPFILTVIAVAIVFCRSKFDWLYFVVLPIGIAGLIHLIFLESLGVLTFYINTYLFEIFDLFVGAHGPLWKRSLDVIWPMFTIYHIEPSAGKLFLIALFLGMLVDRLQTPRTPRSYLPFAAKWLGFFYIVSIAAGASKNYFYQHFAFSIPAFLAVGILGFTKLHTAVDVKHSRVVLCILSVLILISSLALPRTLPISAMRNMSLESRHLAQDAAIIDAVMTDCTIEQYLFLGGGGRRVYGFTKHSPLGPRFAQNAWFLYSQRAIDQFFRQAEAADFIVMENLELESATRPFLMYMWSKFTQTPWPCAQKYRVPEGYRFFYRVR